MFNLLNDIADFNPLWIDETNDIDLGHHCSGNGFLKGKTKLLPEPMWPYHQKYSVASNFTNIISLISLTRLFPFLLNKK